MFKGSSIIRFRTYKHSQLPSVPKKPSERTNKPKDNEMDNEYEELVTPNYNECGHEQRPYGDNKYNQKKTDWGRMEQLLQELAKDGLIPGIDK